MIVQILPFPPYLFLTPFPEHGFYRTEQGRKFQCLFLLARSPFADPSPPTGRHYALNLNQIAASARLTTYAGVIEALLSGRNHYRAW